jgi:hypothetical protein
VLASDSEDILVSFSHVRALCPVLPQFLQRRTVELVGLVLDHHHHEPSLIAEALQTPQQLPALQQPHTL